MLRLFSVCLLLAASVARAADDYQLGPDSQRQAGVPEGKVTQHPWKSKIFAGTARSYYVYVPAQYKADEPACVMVFQDGKNYANDKGQFRVPIVFDNLIHKGQMPVTIGVFIDPGVIPADGPGKPRVNRSFEYDTLSDQYARFVLDEILPEVGKQYKLTDQAAGRAICGISSGGICAFTAAWQRPDAFSKVLSHVGSFTNIRGGHVYPALIRKSEPKPIRVFLQDGSGDLNNEHGNWLLANQEMASALAFAGYDHKFVYGDGAHNGKHGGAILPDSLRWLWRDHPGTKSPSNEAVDGREKTTNKLLAELLIDNEGWQEVAAGYKFTEGPAVDRQKENLYFTDIPANRIYKLNLDSSRVSVFVENSYGSNGLMFGHDKRLYACQNGRKRIVAYDAEGRETTIAENLGSNDLVVAGNLGIYVTDFGNKRVWYIPPPEESGGPHGKARVVDTGIEKPNGIILSPDERTLVVGDFAGEALWAFEVGEDGNLSNKEPYYHVTLDPDRASSGADGMTVDTAGRIYLASFAGLQVFSPTGVLMGIVSEPQRAFLSNATFAGPEMATLYVTSSDKLYRRSLNAHGVVYGAKKGRR